MELWPHQQQGIADVKESLSMGAQRLCLTSPTGGGKSKIAEQLVRLGKQTLVLCSRTMLLEQLARGMNDAGIPYGLQASGYAPSVFDNVQLGMVQTIASRWAKKRMELPPAQLVLVDEIHMNAGKWMQDILGHYNALGVPTIGITATPVGIGHLADHLIVAGKNSDLRKCGALVPAHTYAPDEVDAKCYKSTAKGVLQLRDEVKEVVLKVVFARVIDSYLKLNPDQRPAILFAPGVAESRWLTEQFMNAGIPWSHIDGEHIVLNGEEMASNTENRARLMEASRTGLTKGISNRFVMREGINAPWLYQCILACKFGSLSAYIQAGGRVLRAHPSLDRVIFSDHGGNVHLWDSINCDREWSLDDTDKSIKQKREEALRTKAEPEPVTCPKCSKVRASGATCPACGFAYGGKKRIVIQTDGTLKEVTGDIYKPRKANDLPEAHKLWSSVYWRAYKSNMTFSQARGLFMRENGGTVPPPDAPLLPTLAADWTQKVVNVPFDRLSKGKVSIVAMTDLDKSHGFRS
jgi:superfamily II DNA or RNA helicase